MTDTPRRGAPAGDHTWSSGPLRVVHGDGPGWSAFGPLSGHFHSFAPPLERTPQERLEKWRRRRAWKLRGIIRRTAVIDRRATFLLAGDRDAWRADRAAARRAAVAARAELDRMFGLEVTRAVRDSILVPAAVDPPATGAQGERMRTEAELAAYLAEVHARAEESKAEIATMAAKLEEIHTRLDEFARALAAHQATLAALRRH